MTCSLALNARGPASVWVTVLILLSILAGCSEKKLAAGQVALYPVCGGGMSGLLLEQHELGQTGAKTCVMPDDQLKFEPRQLHIYGYKSRPWELHFRCVGNNARNFYMRHAGGKVALVSDGKVVSTYLAFEPEPSDSCGFATASGAAEALRICDAVASAWGLASSECERVCAAGEEKEVQLCLVAKGR